MIIREPLVQATYYYLREAPGDSPARRQDRHQTFATDVYRTLQSLSNSNGRRSSASTVVPSV